MSSIQSKSTQDLNFAARMDRLAGASPNMKASDFQRDVFQSLQQLPGDAMMGESKRLKELALGYCQKADQLLKQMRLGEVEVARYDSEQNAPFAPGQQEWKCNILRATHLMHAAGAVDGKMALETGQKPQIAECHKDWSAETYHLARSVDSRKDEPGALVEGWKDRPLGDHLRQAKKFESLDIAGDVPSLTAQGSVMHGSVEDILMPSYNRGIHAGLLQSKTQSLGVVLGF